MKTTKIFIAIIVIAFVISMGYGVYVQFPWLFKSKVIVLPPETTTVVETPKEVKKVKKVKKPVNVQLYDRSELQKKYKLDLKPPEEVGAIGVKKTETGKTYTTSVINTETGENKLLQTEVRDKFRLMFDPSLYTEVKVIGSYNTDMARLGTKIGLVRINGNVDFYVKGEVSIRKDEKYSTNYGVYGGVEWKILK